MQAILQAVTPRSFQEYLRPVYQEIKAHLNRFDRLVDRRTMSEADFQDLIGRLGIVPGATVFLHSSMDEITRRVPHLTAAGLIGILQKAIGSDGTLAIPTFPFRGKQYDYVRQHPWFDVARTPSQVGLVTEVFRRMPGVVRSLHPTHPVAAWGRNAKNLTSTHHLGTTFGETSPFYKLKEFDARVVGIGTRLESYTILHVADELHPVQRGSVFAETYPTLLKDEGGEIRYDLRPLKPDAGRNISRVERGLLQREVLLYVTVAGLKCSTTKAGDFIRASLDLIDLEEYL